MTTNNKIYYVTFHLNYLYPTNQIHHGYRRICLSFPSKDIALVYYKEMKLTKAITYAVLKDKAPKKDYEEYSYLLIERILTDSIIGTTIYDKKTKQPHYMAEENEIVKDYYENGVYLSRRKTDKPYIENYGSFKMNENKPIFVNEESEGYIQLPIKTERATIEEEVAYKRLEEEYYGTTFANYLEEVKSRCNRRR